MTHQLKHILILLIIPYAQGIPLTDSRADQSFITKDQYCSNLLNFNNMYYALQMQKNLTGIPADMNVNWHTGNIYFTLISEEMRMTLQVLHPNGEIEIIDIPALGQSTAVDNVNDIVYLATDNGVYKYAKDIELYAAPREDVMYVAVADSGKTLYIATWPHNMVHRIKNNGRTQELFSNIPNGHGLTVDTQNNIYFVATKTTYILKNGDTIPIKITGLPDFQMTGVFVSKSGKVYAMDEKSNFYSVHPDDASATHLGYFTVNGVNSFAMDDNDNVLIGIKNYILKFVSYNRNPCP